MPKYQGKDVTVVRPAVATDIGYNAATPQDLIRYGVDGPEELVLRSALVPDAPGKVAVAPPKPVETIVIEKPGPVPTITSAVVTSPSNGQVSVVLHASDGREFSAAGPASFFSWHTDVAKIAQTLGNAILAASAPRPYTPPHPGNAG